MTAAFRLNEVLKRSSCQDDELSELLREEPPLSRLVLAVLAGGVVVAGSATLCWLTNSDPLGGASLSEESMIACVVGALAALPLVAVKEFLWTSEAKHLVPVLQDLRDTQVQNLAPLISGMSAEQVGIILVMEVVPPLMLLLTGTLGGVRAVTDACVALSISAPVSDHFVSFLAVVISAYFAAAVKNVEWNSSTEQSVLVQNAIKQADSQCRMMAVRRGAPLTDAAADAEAFKAVACTWLASRNMACKLQAALTVAEILYLGTLWHLTGDMCAPVVASVAMHAVDFGRLRHMLNSEPVSGRRLV